MELIKNNSRIETAKKEMNRIQEEGAKQEGTNVFYIHIGPCNQSCVLIIRVYLTQ